MKALAICLLLVALGCGFGIYHFSKPLFTEPFTLKTVESGKALLESRNETGFVAILNAAAASQMRSDRQHYQLLFMIGGGVAFLSGIICLVSRRNQSDPKAI